MPIHSQNCEYRLPKGEKYDRYVLLTLLRGLFGVYGNDCVLWSKRYLMLDCLLVTI